MRGFNFRVALDLSAFFDDYRSKCYIYIDVCKITTIEALEKHIKDRFDIKENILFFANGYYVPTSETIEILETNEVLKVCRGELDASIKSSGIGKKRQKTKKTQTDCGDISLISDNGELVNNGNYGSDTIIEEVLIQDQEQCLSEVKEGKKRKRVQKDSTEQNHADSVEKPTSNLQQTYQETTMLSETVEDLENSKKKKKKKKCKLIDTFGESLLPTPSSESVRGHTEEYNKTFNRVTSSCDISEVTFAGESTIEERGNEQKRKRFRRRKKKNREANPCPNPPWNSRKEIHLSTPKTANSTLNHIRFHSENESETPLANSTVLPGSSPTANEEHKPDDAKLISLTVSKWDEKPPERRYLSPDCNKNSALTLDEVINKTIPISKYESKALIFDYKRDESEKKEEVTAITEDIPGSKVEELPSDNGSVNLCSNTMGSPLVGLPRKNDLIAFKVFRLSEDYTPTLSKHITARVLEYDPNSFGVQLQIIKGHKELAQPRGKFSLDDEEDDSHKKTNVVEVNWNEMLEPLLIFP